MPLKMQFSLHRMPLVHGLETGTLGFEFQLCLAM